MYRPGGLCQPRTTPLIIWDVGNAEDTHAFNAALNVLIPFDEQLVLSRSQLR